MELEVQSEYETRQLARRLGEQLNGGVVIELLGDVGAGKTTFVKGLAEGLGVEDDVQSPSFTISRVYDARDGLQLAHYDFYRLHDAGILSAEVSEVTKDPSSVTVIEWAEVVNGVLPSDRLRITIESTSETGRRVSLTGLPAGVKL